MNPSLRKRPLLHDHALPLDSVGRLVASWRRARRDLDIEPIEVMQRLLRVVQHIQTESATVFARHGLSAPDFAVLVTLVRLKQARVADVSQRRLIDELALTAGTMSVRIDRLEAQGLVERHPDPNDKRNSFIRLTDKGHNVFERATPEHLANQRRLLAALPKDEQHQLAHLLSKLLVEFEGSSWTEDGHAPLGMALAPAHEAIARLHETGETTNPCLLVKSVDEHGAAAEAGIRPDDRLVRAGGRAVCCISGLYRALDAATERGRLRVRLQRRGGDVDVTIKVPVGIRRQRAVTRGRTPNFEHLV